MAGLAEYNKLNDICLYVKDFDGCLKFFTEKFGLKVKRLQPNPETANYAEFDFQGSSVTIWARSGLYKVLDPKHVEGEGHPFMIAIKVPAPADVDKIHADFMAAGVSCIAPPTDYEFGSRAAYYHDFEKNVWEIFAWNEGGDGPGLL